MLLEEIFNVSAIENEEIEFKARLNREDVLGWLKTIAGFANAQGGVLFIGVEDKTNKLIGFSRKDADNERNYLNNSINDHLTPIPNYDLEFIRYSNNQDLYIIKVEIRESVVKPVILKYKGVPSIFVRRQGYTGGATYEEIIKMSIKSQDHQFDNLISDKKYDRDKFNYLFEFYKDHNEGKELSEKSLVSIGFYDKDKNLKNGSLLFMDDYDGGKTAVKCSSFSGFNKGSERVVTINNYEGNILKTINDVLEFVKQRMNRSIIKLADSRINIDAYPERALFEGIINAFAHRDYFLDGTQIQIDMFKDRLEISSPGSFYQGEKLDKTYDLSKIISQRRNELICNVFVLCNIMEASGTGFDKIMEDYSRYDETHQPYIYSTTEHFTLVLPDLTYEKGIVQEREIDLIPIGNGSRYDNEILSYCFNYARSAKEISEKIGVSNSSYFRNTILDNLVKNGLLIKEKEAKTAYYKTNRTLIDRE